MITAQKTKFSIKDFFSKCDQISRLRIWSHLLKKSLIENFIFWAVNRVSHERLRIPLCRNFWLFGNSVNILFIYSERLRVFSSNFETLVKFSKISIIFAYAQIAFTCYYIQFTGFLSWYEIEIYIGDVLS